jgi:hypothetical protein
LIECRAYSAGELLRLQAKAKDLKREIAAVRRKIRQYDARILAIDGDLDPSDIDPRRNVFVKVVAKRGALLRTLTAVLRENSGTALTTRELAEELCRRLDLRFERRKDFWRWAHNSVGKQLHVLHDKGMVERVEGVRQGPTWAASRWRLHTVIGPSADRLLEQLVAAGEEVQLCDDDRE